MEIKSSAHIEGN